MGRDRVVKKRKRRKSAKLGGDATRLGGGKGPTKGGDPCVIQCRGMSPEKILPWAICSLEAIKGKQVQDTTKKERKE